MVNELDEMFENQIQNDHGRWPIDCTRINQRAILVRVNVKESPGTRVHTRKNMKDEAFSKIDCDKWK